MFKNLNIGKKLGLGFGTILVLLCVLSFYNYSSFQEMEAQIGVTEEANAKKNFVVEMEIEHMEWADGLVQLFLDANVNEVVVEKDPALTSLGIWLAGDEAAALAATDSSMAELLGLIGQSHQAMHASAVKINNFWDPEDPDWQEEARRIFALDTKRVMNDTHRYLTQLKEYYAAEAESAAQASKDKMAAAISLMVILAISGIIFGLVAAYFITRGITKPIGRLAAVAEQISIGDVEQSIDIKSKDEIGLLANAFKKLVSYMTYLSNAAQQIAANDLTIEVEPKSEKDVLGKSFKTMVSNLSTVIRQITDNAHTLVSTANQIASSSEEMAKGAQDQTSQVHTVSSAIEEMAATIIESSRNAEDATEASRGASEYAISGGDIVCDTIQGMQTIAQTVRQSADSIGKLARSADQIGEITDVINGIADQTNLLALNAAIEAARAGDQGRGFAVVADEVRKLAERTAKATGEITEMIKGIQTETQEAVASMESGIQEVDKGRALADKAGDSLNEIVTMSQQVMDMIKQMASASEQQGSAAEQISRNVEHIASVTKETALGSEQSATAAEELNRQAENLQSMVAQFRTK